VGFIALKEGGGEEVEPEDKGRMRGRFFAFWKQDEFEHVLRQNGFEVLVSGVREAGEARPRLLCFWVKTV
jgi:hypothetical protein